MQMLSTPLLNELVAKEGRFLQWEMPFPHGSLKRDYFTMREVDGKTILIIESGGREIIEDFLRQGFVAKDTCRSSQGCWIFTPTEHVTGQ
jgi:hypothetical protein